METPLVENNDFSERVEKRYKELTALIENAGEVGEDLKNNMKERVDAFYKDTVEAGDVAEETVMSTCNALLETARGDKNAEALYDELRNHILDLQRQFIEEKE